MASVPFRVAAFLGGLLLFVHDFGQALASDEMEEAPTLAELQPLESGEAEQLGEYDISDLQRIKVTSVSRTPEKIADAPGAIFVITQEDIRRSGVASVPEALRMAPGLNVARIDAGRYAISARGFNDRFSNKLLVLMDGRAIYTPSFGGVFWESQDAFLDDLDRIEVIRGPGGTLWGANAFNGVINITSRKAADTQGWLVQGGGGNQERAFGAVRYGGAISDVVHYRAYAKALDRDDIGGADHSSGLRSGQMGFRIDGAASANDALTFQGDVYRVTSGETVRIPNQVPPLFVQISNDELHFTGGNLLGRFSRELGRGSEAAVHFYYDRSRVMFDATGEEHVENTGDIELVHRFYLTRRNQLVWGLGYRVVQDESIGTYSIAFIPANRTTQVLSFFVEDTFRITPVLSVIAGSKFEHNDYTGLELQPNVRGVWIPSSKHTIWTAISRAIRSPTRLENDVSVAVTTLPGPIVLRKLGNPDALSESMIAYGLGYRVQAQKWLSLDVAAFFHQYDNLVSSEFGSMVTSLVPPELQIVYGSKLHGSTFGGELASQIKLLRWWSLQPAYSFLRMQLDASQDSRDPVTVKMREGSSPRHQFSLRSRMDLPRQWELDGWLRYVGELPSLSIPSYVTVDARIGWRPVERLELSMTGQNLVQDAHPEFSPTIRAPQEQTDVKRSLFGKITWRL